MNYYEKHLGDYHKDAGHLSMAEHGAYNLLLDKYYATEKPIPLKDVYKIARARTPEERETVDAVLAEFFTLEDDGYHQKRCDEVIAAFADGEPDRELKKTNESSRQKKYRDDRNRMFEALHAVGQFPSWNVAMADLRSLYATHCAGSETPQDASRNASQDKPQTSEVTSCDEPATREATATRLQSPIPNPQSPDTNLTHTQSARAQSESVSRGALNGEGKGRAKAVDQTDAQADHVAFQRLKAAYPKFAGRQDWINAEHYCHLRLDEDETWETLLAAVERYAKHIRAKGCEGTQFVLSPGKFFSAPDQPWRQEWAVPKASGTTGAARRLTPIEIIERAILDGRSDDEIAAMPELELVPTVREDIRAMRQEINQHAQH